MAVFAHHATIDSETARSIANEILPGAGSAVSQVLDIDDELVQDNSILCDALSSTFKVEGSAIAAPE